MRWSRSRPDTFLMPRPGDMRYQWVVVRLATDRPRRARTRSSSMPGRWWCRRSSWLVAGRPPDANRERRGPEPERRCPGLAPHRPSTRPGSDGAGPGSRQRSTLRAIVTKRCTAASCCGGSPHRTELTPEIEAGDGHRHQPAGGDVGLDGQPAEHAGAVARGDRRLQRGRRGQHRQWFDRCRPARRRRAPRPTPPRTCPVCPTPARAAAAACSAKLAARQRCATPRPRMHRATPPPSTRRHRPRWCAARPSVAVSRRSPAARRHRSPRGRR